MENTETSNQIKQGFIPDKTAKKLLLSWQGCAYLYPDGIMITEEKTFKSGKLTTKEELFHVWYCNIPLIASGNNHPSHISRIVCHEKDVLLDGIKQFEVYYDNASTAMEKLNLKCNTFIFTTISGAHHRVHQFPFIDTGFTIQYDDKSLHEVVENVLPKNFTFVH